MTQEHPFAYLRKRADLKRCCHREKNLRVIDKGYGILVAVCLVCTRKHRKMTCEPGVYNLRGAVLINPSPRPPLDFPHRRVLRGLA